MHLIPFGKLFQSGGSATLLANVFMTLIICGNHCRNLKLKFSELLPEAGNLCNRLTVFIDGIDLLDDLHQALSLDWIPETIPKVHCVKNCKSSSET